MSSAPPVGDPRLAAAGPQKAKYGGSVLLHSRIYPHQEKTCPKTPDTPPGPTPPGRRPHDERTIERGIRRCAFVPYVRPWDRLHTNQSSKQCLSVLLRLLLLSSFVK